MNRVVVRRLLGESSQLHRLNQSQTQHQTHLNHIVQLLIQCSRVGENPLPRDGHLPRPSCRLHPYTLGALQQFPNLPRSRVIPRVTVIAARARDVRADGEETGPSVQGGEAMESEPRPAEVGLKEYCDVGEGG